MLRSPAMRKLSTAANVAVGVFLGATVADLSAGLQEVRHKMRQLEIELRLTRQLVEVCYIPEAYNSERDRPVAVYVIMSGCLACGIDGLQPATLGLAALQTSLHFWGGGHRVDKVSSIAYAVIEGGEWNRLVSATLLHKNFSHLSSNMDWLLWEGTTIERWLGSSKILQAVVFTGAASQAIELGAIWVGKHILELSTASSKYHRGAIGFSGVTFALKVIADDVRAARWWQHPVLGWLAPLVRYRAWLYLHGDVYRGSTVDTLGHLAGLLAGLAYVHCHGLWFLPGTGCGQPCGPAQLPAGGQPRLQAEGQEGEGGQAAVAVPPALAGPAGAAVGVQPLVPGDNAAAVLQGQGDLGQIQGQEQQATWWHELAVVLGHVAVGGIVIYRIVRLRGLF